MQSVAFSPSEMTAPSQGLSQSGHQQIIIMIIIIIIIIIERFNVA